MPQDSSSPFSKFPIKLSPRDAFWISAGALALFGFLRKPTVGLAVAGAAGVVAFKTASSRPVFYDARAKFLLNATPEQAYEVWRNFAELPRFMSHLKAVHVIDDIRSEWVAVGPGGREVSWRAEITDDVPGAQISWQSLPGSEISNRGSVSFVPDPQGRGTLIVSQVSYSLPLGPVAAGLLKLLGKSPAFVLQEDVRRFKSLLEAGEAPTTQGQSHGPRGFSGKVKGELFRETSNHPEPQAVPVAEPELQSA